MPEQLGKKHPKDAAKLIRKWAEEHTEGNYHDQASVLNDLAGQVESDWPYPVVSVIRSGDLFGTDAVAIIELDADQPVSDPDEFATEIELT